MEKSAQTVTMFYQNYRGETSKRTVTPISMRWGRSKWHPSHCWLLKAFDHGKQAVREFALADADFKDSK